MIRQICSYKEIETSEGSMMPDHVHKIVMISPKYASSAMGYTKGESSLMIFDRFSQWKYKDDNKNS
ncbi:transposase [Mailhella massiliensis]|uniref:transposase n=1 Tax=Mailhella massiliensis TaxID=1903261 RepID=UPI003B5BDF13